MASAASYVDPAIGSAESGQEEEARAEVEEEVAGGQEGGEEEEEEGECGFCLFMKGGGCKDAFVAWEDCVQAAEDEGSDMVERCFQATADLKKCMDAHNDYYYPVLQAEEAVSDQAAAAIADANNIKVDDSAPSHEKKEDAAQSTPDAAVTDEKDTSSPAAGTKMEEEAVVEKVGSLSLSN